ncbi:TPA: lysozyme [Acinetobacter baumannii]|nr:lysozyme [Acinetobacter baumannii]
MSTDQQAQIAATYSWLRAMSGGTLTKDQVVAGDQIIAALGLDVFAKSINFTLGGISGLRDISDKGYSLIKKLEGFRANAYLDTGNVWTIGFGTIKYPDGRTVKQGDTCTEEQATQWLINDCKWVDACLDRYVTVPVTQNQFDSLASFVYNVGETQFTKSTMLRLINTNNGRAAAEQFDRWIFDAGHKIEGLANRRAAEKQLFVS